MTALIPLALLALLLLVALARPRRVRDPVCDTLIDAARAEATRVYGHATYHLCSMICAKRFDRTPWRFAGGWPEVTAPVRSAR